VWPIALAGCSTASTDVSLPNAHCGTVAGTDCLVFDNSTDYSLALLNLQAGAGQLNRGDPSYVSTNGINLQNSLVLTSPRAVAWHRRTSSPRPKFSTSLRRFLRQASMMRSKWLRTGPPFRNRRPGRCPLRVWRVPPVWSCCSVAVSWQSVCRTDHYQGAVSPPLLIAMSSSR
jgi:hypothetical protein